MRSLVVSKASLPFVSLLALGDKLYGTTYYGGDVQQCNLVGCGTIFSVDRVTGTKAAIHIFEPGGDGFGPYANLIRAGWTLYGTTERAAA